MSGHLRITLLVALCSRATSPSARSDVNCAAWCTDYAYGTTCEVLDCRGCPGCSGNTRAPTHPTTASPTTASPSGSPSVALSCGEIKRSYENALCGRCGSGPSFAYTYGGVTCRELKDLYKLSACPCTAGAQEPPQ